MKMDELIRHDIPPAIIKLWRERESDTLLPLQEVVVKRNGLFGEKNLLIQAPTSSGKTFIGEMAAIQTALRRKKVVYLVPLKALAEEKYLDFREKYAPYGLRVIVSTRDHREFDEYLENGNFSIAVVVYEKLSQLLVRRPERLEEIELIIADELELLSDPDRGGMVELLITRILRTGRRLIGMSAVLGEAEKLAEWLGADLVLYERRPVELRYGVLHAGVFKYRTYNDLTEGEEPLVDIGSDSSWEILTANLCLLVARREPCLVFVKAKHESRRGAELLAQRVEQPPAATAIEKLRALEPTRSRDCLLETLAHGVAFHNADLSREERKIVEDAFRAGEVKVLVSTSTLASGMNLPAQNVFIASDKWRYDNRFGMPWKTPILRAEYENMGGRGGRYGSGQPFGRSILIAPTLFDQETLWRRYIEGEREKVSPQLGQASLENHILQLVASRSCRTEEELRAFLESTLTGRWVWRETLTVEECEFHIRSAVNRCLDAGMVAKTSEGRLDATPLGLAVAAKGVTIATARELEHWIAESETRIWSNIDPILAAALSEDGRMVQVSLTGREYDHADYPGQLKQLTAQEDIGADVPLNRLRNCNLAPFFEEVKGIKVALFLTEWIEHAALCDLETRFHTMTGQIVAAAEQIVWLIDATAGIATALGAQSAFIERLRTLTERVQRGLREEALALGRLKTPELTRNEIISLTNRGLHSPEALAKTPVEVLAQWLPSRNARALHTWALRNGKQADSVSNEHAGAPARPVLVVDDRHPGRILLDDIPIRLQEKQYRLIRTLAAFPGDCVPYETIYTAVWGDTIVESNQMHFQKRKLLGCIQSAIPGRADLIATVPKRGFTLNLTPEEVVLHTALAATAA